jgi:hypothetical protein
MSDSRKNKIYTIYKMSCILYVEDDDAVRKVNIDELYEKDQRRDLKQLSIFNKILNRVHRRITITSRTKRNEKFIWFTIPEFIFGEPVYNKTDCIAYVVTKLEENGFFIRFIYPNTLFITWDNWVPSYTRNEIKKKTGIVLDEKGNIVDKIDRKEQSDNPNSRILNDRNSTVGTSQKEQKQYTPIQTYKPTGNLVYNQDFFDKIEKKVSFS